MYDDHNNIRIIDHKVTPMAGSNQIDVWLAQLGLGQYVDVFKANDITLRALPYLDENDLQELGISLGHRRILIAEIKKLPLSDNKAHTTLNPESIEEEAERRQLTVVFCDLVGSTVLSQRLDPEEMREILRQYQNLVSAAVRHYQGYVARFVGDGILSYFGWPRAYEDQAERAIRASIDIVNKIKQLTAADFGTLQVRIGVDTGLVVVGDLIGDATSDLNTVVGDTPNLAARLQNLAAPDDIIIGANTRGLLGATFKLKSLGPQELKGFNQDILAWKVLSERETESRFDAVRGKTLTSLVGREHELGLLTQRWRLAQEGEGQIVLLSGEAGIGKSRLARDFKMAISRDLRFNLSYQCSPHYSNSAFFPIIQRLQRAVNFKENDALEDKLDKLEKSLQLWGSNPKKVAPLFAQLMSVPGEQRYGPLELTPQQLRQRTIEAMIEQILALSQRRSVYVLVEDAHWIDPSMMDFISELMPRITDRPIMIMVTYRPENAPEWLAHPHLTSISLNRLGRKHAAEIAHSVGGQELMEAMIEKIVSRADGVPLYIEELTKSVIESFSSDKHSIDPGIIPPTLQLSLMARLDRLDDAKEIAQIGAVIGREFSYDLVTAISAKSQTEIKSALTKLLDSGLVFKRGVAPNEIYTFKHSLVQDAAYDTILISRRRRLHALIAEVLEAEPDKLSAETSDLLAHHAFQAELWEKAFGYLQQAGRKAMDRASVREAIALFEQALIAGSHLPETDDLLQQDIDLRFDLRNALWSIGEFERILTILTEAERLATKLDDTVRIGWISVFSSASLWQLGRSDQALAAAQNAIRISKKADDLPLSIGAQFYLGCVTVTSGACREAETVFQKICDDLGGEMDYERCGLPFLPAVIARSWMVWALAERGEFKQAQVLGNEALAIAKKVNHPFNIAHIYYDLGYFYYLKGESAKAVQTLEQARDIINEWGLTYLSPFITGFLGYAYALNGDSTKAVNILKKALAAYQSIGLGLFRSLVQVYMGKALLLDGQIEQAFEQCDRALALARKRHEQGHQAYALHVLGEITAHPDFLNKDLAVNYFNEALEIAKTFDMRPLQAECYKSLSAYYHNENNLQKAEEYNNKTEKLRQSLAL